ncbi:MAG: GTPase Era [Nitrospinae bacterium]|nr:GTPase Era [Nitrospinota bacterium]
MLASESTGFKSGYASLIGKPNVGKSTLLNHLVATKLAAISRRPQTTRNKITGICHLPGGQLILMDTPGIHQATSKLNQAMVKTSMSTYRDVDLIVFMIDAKQKFRLEDEFVLESLKGVKAPVFLVINKIDLVPKPELLRLIEELNSRAAFTDIIPISALKEDGLDLLKELLLKHLPEGPQYFPEDMITDCPEEFLVGEIIREKIIKLTHLEVPYAVAVMVESMREGQKGVIVIDAVIYVEKASQKKIVIGEKGALLKKIGSQARAEIEKRLGNKVYLNSFVKVKQRWRDNPRYLREFGYTHGHH